MRTRCRRTLPWIALAAFACANLAQADIIVDPGSSSANTDPQPSSTNTGGGSSALTNGGGSSVYPGAGSSVFTNLTAPSFTRRSCGTFGGIGLSMLLTASGCWMVRNRRHRHE
jgi:hypothetical protein